MGHLVGEGGEKVKTINFLVMRQRIIIEEAVIAAETEAQAKRIAESPSHSGFPTKWEQTEAHDFILQAKPL